MTLKTQHVELKAVSRTYPGASPVHALQHVELTLRNGEFVAIVGQSGSGKSTLLNILGLLDTPSSGSYFLNGLDVSSLTDAARTGMRSRHIGFVFQSFHLMSHRTVLANVVLPLVYRGVSKKERTQRGKELLTLVGLEHRIDALARTLSGGESQRVAIARALIGKPDLILCDEPTGNLDSVTSESILMLLEELKKSGLTIVVVTHDPSVSSRAGRTIHIQDGVMLNGAHPRRRARAGK